MVADVILALLSGAAGGAAAWAVLLRFPRTRAITVVAANDLAAAPITSPAFPKHGHNWRIEGKRDGAVVVRCAHCSVTKLKGEPDPVSVTSG